MLQRANALGIVWLTLFAACTGSIDDAGGMPPRTEDLDAPPFEPGTRAVPRLTLQQYRNSIFDLTGLSFESPAPLDQEGEGVQFSDETAAEVTTDALTASRYQGVATEIANSLIESGNAQSWAECAPVDDADPCIREFLETFLRRAFRRPPSEAEITRHTALFSIALEGGLGADAAIGASVRAALQSPHFLYRVELAEGGVDEAGVGKIDGYALASKLAFFLTDRPPDDELLDAAGDGSLEEAHLYAAQVDRLLASPDAQEGMWRHLDEWFSVWSVHEIAPDEGTFGVLPMEVGEYLAADFEYRLRQAALAPGADFMSVYTTRVALINDVLANIYGVEGDYGAELIPYEFEAGSVRSGVLTSPGWLASTSTEVETSAVKRGNYIQRRLLCGTVPPPPVDVDDVIQPQTAETITQRERLAEHRDNPRCYSCHQVMDPLGLPFENFDALGQWRDEDTAHIDGELLRAPIDASGDLDGVAIDGALELSDALAASARARRCVSEMLYRRGFNAPAGAYQSEYLNQLDDIFVEEGRELRALFRAMALSPEFRLYAEQGESR